MSSKPPLRVDAGAPAPQKPASDQSPVVPAHIRPLLGPSWLIEGEDPQIYEELLARVGAAVDPLDVIDWLLVKDVVALTWQIQRTRRHCDALMRGARRASMIKLLQVACSRLNSWDPKLEKEIEALVSDWLAGDKEAAEGIESMLAQSGLSIADVAPQTLTLIAEELDRIDQQTQRHEERRDKILQQIERRRLGWAKLVRQASEEVVDAEFTETAPTLAEDRARAKAAE